MKKLYILFIFIYLICFLPFFVQSQNYGNEWIDYNRKYLKFAIVRDDIYRIDYTSLNKAMQKIGVSLNNINPQQIKIYGRGNEIPLYIYGENDGKFDNGDFIEFYAKKNDGWFDERLYPSANTHTNPYYSNFTDTAYYFLTWDNKISLRFQIENDTNFSNYNIHKSIWVTRIQSFKNYYCTGAYRNNMEITAYKPAEGWVDTRLYLGTTGSKNILTSNLAVESDSAELEFAFASVNSPTFPHHMQVSLEDNLLIDTIYSGIQYIRHKTKIPKSWLKSSSTKLYFKSIDDNKNTTSYQSMVYVRFCYAHSFTLESDYSNYFFSAKNISGSKVIFPFVSSTIGKQNDEVILYDLTNNLRIHVDKMGNSLRAIVPNYGKDIECYLTSVQQISNIDTLFPVNESGEFTNYLNHKNTNFFIVASHSLLTKAKEYALYRNTVSPYKYVAYAFDVNELYDQFAYGIKNNPLAIRNLIRYAYASFDKEPQYLFLLGRAYPSDLGRKNTNVFQATLVPTIGSIPSDYAITMGLGDTNEYFCLPTGRLSTSLPQQIDWYLQKIQEYEQAQQTSQKWMKQILHFGGGSNITEQRTFANYLNNYKNIAEGAYWGANVHTFLKSSSDPMEINLSDSLRNLINNGVQMMTFFGHAGGTGFDISIDDPEEYNNNGKYFVLLGNSCYAGNIFNGENNYSERFIHIPNKGAIAYISPSGVGNSLYLNSTCGAFYNHITNESYGKSIGYCLQKAIKATTNLYGKDKMDYTLHGDPCLIVTPSDKPDFTLSNNDIQISPESIGTELDSFTIDITFTNQGKITTDSFYVAIEHIFPNGTSENIYVRLASTAFQNQFSVKFAINKDLAPGKNEIKIHLDMLNEIPETNENNNSVAISFTITSSTILPIYPYKYAIVANKNISLIASTNFYDTTSIYQIQIDTCDMFNSSFMQQYETQSSTGIVEWKLPFSLSDSMVYYWRVNKKNDTSWKESSFQYILGKTGSSQAHFYQFKDNEFFNMEQNRNNQNFTFNQGVFTYSIKTRFFNSLSEQAANETEVYIKRNNVIFDQVQCVMVNRPFIHIVVIDPITGENWINNETSAYGSVGKYGQVLCRGYATNSFNFYMDDSISRENVAIFLENIPNNYHVLIMSINHTGSQWFTETQYRAWESIGSTQIRTLTPNNNYIIFGKKGASANDPDIREIVGTNNGQFLIMNGVEHQVAIGNAKMITEKFGPAKQWKSFHWEVANHDLTLGDTATIDVYGKDIHGNEQLIFRNLKYPENADLFDLNKIIDAQKYPYLYLVVHLKDIHNRSIPQIKRLQLMYEDIPETSVYSTPFAFYKDTIQQGDTLLLTTSTKNISSVDMSNLLVKYSILENNNEIFSTYKRLAPHYANQILSDTISIATTPFSGNKILRVEYNPDNDQLEKHHYNNYIEVPFYITTDSINPILDVTFDGNHIIDGELVSATPFIKIMVKDENKFLLMDDIKDTSKIKVYLKTPRNDNYQYVPFFSNNEEILQFIPANEKNKCQIHYEAQFIEDGTYFLRVVANDKSNNASGDNAYVISFKVINKSTITEVYNYPNPFSTRTQFVFTLTGSQLPTYMKIQIMTISGKIVKEIDMSELGTLRIGKNITEYAWDGRDEYGDLLANGIYLYRVITRINDKDIELNSQSSNSKAFKKDFGKMVIIR